MGTLIFMLKYKTLKGYDTVQCGIRTLRFRRNILPPSLKKSTLLILTAMKTLCGVPLSSEALDA
jgi:hypothetical protein